MSDRLVEIIGRVNAAPARKYATAGRFIRAEALDGSESVYVAQVLLDDPGVTPDPQAPDVAALQQLFAHAYDDLHYLLGLVADLTGRKRPCPDGHAQYRCVQCGECALCWRRYGDRTETPPRPESPCPRGGDVGNHPTCVWRAWQRQPRAIEVPRQDENTASFDDHVKCAVKFIERAAIRLDQNANPGLASDLRWLRRWIASLKPIARSPRCASCGSTFLAPRCRWTLCC